MTQLADLAGRTVTVPEATSYVATLGPMAGDFAVEESALSSHAILDAVAEGEVDVTPGGQPPGRTGGRPSSRG